MYVYVDETGNTGKNLFDEDQPNFLTAALVSRTNFDVLHSSKIKAIAHSIGEDALHANEIGFRGIEEIAEPLRVLLKKSQVRFLFSRVEKRYLLATKVVDHLFDSGENTAVPWHVYNIRPLRIMMVFKVASLLDLELAQLFWDCLMEGNEQKCRALLVRFSEKLLPRIESLPDQRSQDLVHDALDWVIANPEALQIHTKTKHARLTHMPNMVAFANLLGGLQFLSEKMRRPVKRITHDRQDQFEKTLEAWHELYSRASNDQIHVPGEVYTLQKVPGSSFELKADEDSSGLQVIDIILWVFRQFMRGREILPRTSRLLDDAMKKGWQSDFSFRGAGELTEARLDEVFQAEVSETQMQQAHEMLAQFENVRDRNIEAYEKEGMLPFERVGQPGVPYDIHTINTRKLGRTRSN